LKFPDCYASNIKLEVFCYVIILEYIWVNRKFFAACLPIFLLNIDYYE
jgi:hypothetical protein